MKGPCYGCQKRQVGCHGSCAEYAEYAAEQRRANRWLEDKNRVMLKHSAARYDKCHGRYIYPKKGAEFK